MEIMKAMFYSIIFISATQFLHAHTFVLFFNGWLISYFQFFDWILPVYWFTYAQENLIRWKYFEHKKVKFNFERFFFCKWIECVFSFVVQCKIDIEFFKRNILYGIWNKILKNFIVHVITSELVYHYFSQFFHFGKIWFFLFLLYDMHVNWPSLFNTITKNLCKKVANLWIFLFNHRKIITLHSVTLINAICLGFFVSLL